MGKMSRDKGKRFERDVEKEIASRDLDYSRHQDGHAQPADFRVEGFQLEARHREAISICAWSREIEEKTPEHLTPAVAYRKNHEPARVSLLLTDFLDLVAEARS